KTCDLSRVERREVGPRDFSTGDRIEQRQRRAGPRHQRRKQYRPFFETEPLITADRKRGGPRVADLKQTGHRRSAQHVIIRNLFEKLREIFSAAVEQSLQGGTAGRGIRVRIGDHVAKRIERAAIAKERAQVADTVTNLPIGAPRSFTGKRGPDRRRRDLAQATQGVGHAAQYVRKKGGPP